jgi:D-alanyl-D-alanine endopeptidase (penicillin-binding protein 7)
MIERFFAPWILAGLFTGVWPIDAALYTSPTPDMVSVASLLPRAKTVPLPAENAAFLPPIKRVLQNYTFPASADSVALYDAATGELLYGKNIGDSRPIGSITKLMTGLVFLDVYAGDLADSVMLLEEDRTYGGRFYLPFAVPLSVGDVLAAALVGSDNSATTALVRISGLSREAFVARMNERAVAMGLRGTFFADWTGLAAQNVATANDVALLLRTALATPALGERMQLVEAVVSVGGVAYTIPSTNELMGTLVAGEGKVIGGKTGYIPEAGYCVTARVMSDGAGIDAVVLSARTQEGRFTDLATGIAWAYETFTWPTYE